jgi:hypothetical protein
MTDAADLQTLLDVGGRVFIPADTYIFDDIGLIVPEFTNVICEPGTVFDLSSADSGLLAVSSSGTEGTSINVTSAVSAGSYVLPVANGDEVGFSAGDIVRVKSDDVFDPARSDTLKAELAYVASTATGSITLRTPIRDTYTTGITVTKINPVRGVKWNGGLIIGTGSSSDTQQGIKFSLGLGCQINDLTCEGVSSSNINLFDCLDSVIRNPRTEDALHAVTGYGVNIGLASMGCRLEGGSSRRTRHGFTIGGSTTRGGVARDIIIEDYHVEDSFADGIDTHGNCEHITMDTVYVIGSEAQGVNVEGKSATLRNVHALRCASVGINMVSGAAAAGHYSLNGATVEDCGAQGINAGLAPGSPEPVLGTFQFSDLRIKRCVNEGLRLQSLGTGRIKGINVTNLDMDACGTTGTTKINLHVKKAESVTINGFNITNANAAASGIRYDDVIGS